jgi:RNA polymerase sigma-70 factor (ECF subfamily)
LQKDALIVFLEEPTPNHFAALFEEAKSFVHAVALRATHDRTLAEDVAEDVFLKVLQRRWRASEVRSQRGFLAALTLSLARTRLRSEARRSKREGRGKSLEDLPAKDGLSAEDVLEIHGFIARLPPALRQSVELMYFAGMKAREIAGFLHVPLRTVQHRLKLAHGALRLRLKSSFGACLLPYLRTRWEQLVRSIVPSPRLEEKLRAHASEHFA